MNYWIDMSSSSLEWWLSSAFISNSRQDQRSFICVCFARRKEESFVWALLCLERNSIFCASHKGSVYLVLNCETPFVLKNWEHKFHFQGFRFHRRQIYFCGTCPNLTFSHKFPAQMGRDDSERCTRATLHQRENSAFRARQSHRATECILFSGVTKWRKCLILGGGIEKLKKTRF